MVQTYDKSPVKLSSGVDRCTAGNNLESTSLENIQMPVKMVKRERPKGSDLTIIGLAKRQKTGKDSCL